ncbi:hypothetical protein NM208_g14589 [Fusarium decemcellulare]|uniref:Uncharacterized protein n=1 Tax=Fusarium decemcellulare TaxID=57161 RepID=A0ACC1RFI6_9HYPO|nr:hypothetical protein NM208_g14589 [Fusarium decemcellulare]
MSTNTPTLVTLPPELMRHITSLLPKTSLMNLRCVNKKLCSIVTPEAFRTARLWAYGKNPERFIQLAKSNFSDLVQEITCDARLGVDDPFSNRRMKQLPLLFWDALHFLGCFRNLKALHFQSTPDRSWTEEEDWDMAKQRNRAMKTILLALQGTLSRASKGELERVWMHPKASMTRKVHIHRWPTHMPNSPITLSTFSASEVEVITDPSLPEAPPPRWEALAGVTDLRLCMASNLSGYDRARGEGAAYLKRLPLTWLSPSITMHLRVLSLYSPRLWAGGEDQTSFRLLGDATSIPNLKVLSLGRFIFSDMKEIDWILQFDLEKLYFDACFLLIRYLVQPDLGETGRVRSEDAKFHPMRWHTIFSRIRKSMPASLRIFKIGTGISWMGAPKKTVKAALLDDPDLRRDELTLRQPFKHNAFRYFDCPSETYDKNFVADANDDSKLDMFRYGTGLLMGHPNCQCRYEFEFQVDMSLIDKDDVMGGKDSGPLSKDVRKKDRAAYRRLAQVLEERRTKMAS